MKNLGNLFSKFFGRLLPATIGAIVGFMLAISFVIGGLVDTLNLAIDETNKPSKIEPKSILKLTLAKPIVEDYEFDPIRNLNLSSFSEDYLGLRQIKKALQIAASEEGIQGVFLNISDVQAGYASLAELRSAIRKFQESGKFVITFSDIISERALFLATVSDEFYVNPVGYVEFNGLVSNKVFIKGMLEKLGVKPEIFKVGSYKSAVEPLQRDNMSDSSRYQTTVLIESLYGRIINQMSEDLEIDSEELRALSDSFQVRKGNDALKYKLVTNTGYLHNAEERIRELLEEPSGTKLNYIGVNKLIHGRGATMKSDNRVAVIVAQGEIVGGKGDKLQIGSSSLITEIRKARSNDTIKAVVLRINSPGGSALASEIIWKELELTRQNKPVIASMSDVAASGGYYIATGCDSIVANPTTITGSIGVFGILLNVDSFLKDKLGITTDRVGTGPFSDFGSGTRKMTEREREIMQAEVEDIYSLFLKRVATARGLSLEEVNRLAKGRVYSGMDAYRVGLVDKLGTLSDAIEIAAAKAGITEYDIQYLPRQKMVIEELMETLEGGESVERKELLAMLPYIKAIKSLSEKVNQIQARLPYDLIIE